MIQSSRPTRYLATAIPSLHLMRPSSSAMSTATRTVERFAVDSQGGGVGREPDPPSRIKKGGDRLS